MFPTVGIFFIIAFLALAFASRRLCPMKGQGFTFVVLATGGAAMTFPAAFVSWGGFELKTAITPLVQVILLGMGLTLTLDDFRRVVTMPRGVILCCALHYTIMPLAGWGFAHLFGLQGAAATGLILIGSVPSGTSSNVISLLARVNVPLSVTVTAVSTLLSPLITPFAMKLLAGTEAPIDAWAMMISIFKMIITPLAAGLVMQRLLPGVARRLAGVLPYIAMFAICAIIGVTIALSHEQLLTVGLAIFAASACHNATGYVLGYWGGRLAGLNQTDARTCALEVGIQNGGMATGLAFNVLHSPAAALAAAVFGPWSAISSSALASWWRRPACSPSVIHPSETLPP
ncbi:bile acid:sodium symporter family protein [Prosthecobacter sp.]|uniref:bile acid:sodium symporter family protein n=1 Tax=Prosthecobacter sp. TaxID=1965333 RepID=UPI0037831880